MAMFDKHKGAKQSTAEVSEPRVAPPPPAAPAPSVAEKVAMIGRGIRVTGDVTAGSNLRVEGEIEGRSVNSSHDIEVAEAGRIVASIEAKVVRVAGEVSGDITGTEKVVILKSGRVQGNIVAPRVQLEDGALFRGSIDMTPEPAAVKAAPVKAPVADAAGRTPAMSAAQGSEAASGGARKEPGLTLKSG